MIKRNELIEAIQGAEIEIVNIETIKYDQSVYSRTGGIDRNAVEDYSKHILTMPPIVISQNNKIVDGVHRFHACKKADQQSMNVKRIEILDEDIKLANLLIDIHSGVRHPIEDKKSIVIDLYDPQNAEQNKLLMQELDVPERTFYDWTKNKRSLMQKQVNQAMAIDLLNPNLKQDDIAKMYGYTSDKTISRYKSKLTDIFAEIAKMSVDELVEGDLDFLIEYKDFVESELQLYNIWNKSKGDNNSHFGHFPLGFMKNLLYYHTKPFELVYDPFAGSGTTVDACRQMYRQCIVSDRKPDKSRPEIFEHDVANGLPEMKKPDFVFLDPPYWKQAENKYSEDADDLANMPLDQFYQKMWTLFNGIASINVQKIAVVISPTQYPNDMIFEDHVFKFDRMLSDKYEIEMRYIIPYSTQQYNGTQVIKAKEEMKCLSLNRDLIVWRLK